MLNNGGNKKIFNWGMGGWGSEKFLNQMLKIKKKKDLPHKGNMAGENKTGIRRCDSDVC